MQFLTDEFKKGGFVAWVFTYFISGFTILSMQYNSIISTLMYYFLGFYLWLALFEMISNSLEHPSLRLVQNEYHMHVFLDLLFGIMLATLFHVSGLYEYFLLTVAITFIDVLFTDRRLSESHVENQTEAENEIANK